MLRVFCAGFDPDVQIFCETRLRVVGDGIATPTRRYLAPAAFSAANRSLKSGLTAIEFLPFLVFEYHVPHELQARLGRDCPPERPIERSVVVVEPDDIHYGLSSLFSPARHVCFHWPVYDKPFPKVKDQGEPCLSLFLD